MCAIQEKVASGAGIAVAGAAAGARRLPEGRPSELEVSARVSEAMHLGHGQELPAERLEQLMLLARASAQRELEKTLRGQRHAFALDRVQPCEAAKLLREPFPAPKNKRAHYMLPDDLERVTLKAVAARASNGEGVNKQFPRSNKLARGNVCIAVGKGPDQARSVLKRLTNFVGLEVVRRSVLG